jgi:glycosyltransferase involved in cell wall biosynthesis
MNKPRILYSFPSTIGDRGIGHTAYHQVLGLINQGLDVSLFCGFCVNSISGLHYQRQTLSLCGLRLPRRPLGVVRSSALHDRIVARALRRFSNRIDIIHCWPGAALQTIKVARELGIKTVLERPSAHTGYVFDVCEKECRKLHVTLKRSHYAKFNRRKLAHEEAEFAAADWLLCPSDFVKKTFIDRGFEQKRLIRHQYGFDPSVFSPAEQPPHQSNGSLFTMLYVGDCFPLKGLHFALQAWLRSKASRQGKFYICGQFVPGYQKLLKKQLSHPSVEYLGFVSDVAEIMRRSDALVLPSLAEGSALVTYEARACGCVLLISNASGAVCEHNKHGLVHKAGDVDTLTKHIDLLATQPRLISTLRSKSLADTKNLTWQKSAVLLTDIYRQCLNKQNETRNEMQPHASERVQKASMNSY